MGIHSISNGGSHDARLDHLHRLHKRNCHRCRSCVLRSCIGFSHGVESAWNGVQATCEDPEAQTKINGRTYMCVTKEQWNEVAERIFRQGVALGVKRAREAT